MAKYRFKLLAGQYTERWNWIKGPEGNMIPDPANPGGHTYRPGDIIETDQDLSLFDKTSAPGHKKFQLIDGVRDTATREELLRQKASIDQRLEEMDTDPNTPSVNANPPGFDGDSTLDAMTVDELKKFAASEEIDLGNARNKAEIIARIKAANLAGV